MTKINAVLMAFLRCSSANVAQVSEDISQDQPQSEEEKTDHVHDDPETYKLRLFDNVEVSGRGDNLLGIAGSSNKDTTGRRALENRPKLRAGEPVETIPCAIKLKVRAGRDNEKVVHEIRDLASEKVKQDIDEVRGEIRRIGDEVEGICTGISSVCGAGPGGFRSVVDLAKSVGKRRDSSARGFLRPKPGRTQRELAVLDSA